MKTLGYLYKVIESQENCIYDHEIYLMVIN